ncbi:MAG: ribonuclease P protein component [Acidimicrobiales bacterium]
MSSTGGLPLASELGPFRVSSKRTFALIRTSRRRARSGPIAVQYVSAVPADRSRYVAYAVPRRVGTAVERNTYRRRIRAVVSEAVEAVPAGTYLIGVGPGVKDVSFQELRSRVIEVMNRASRTTRQ